MSKEYLEALGKNIRYKKEYVGNDTYRLYIKKNEMEFLEKSLQCLESIDNASPSEALKELKELHELAYGNEETSWKIDEIRMSSHIKQALLKAQEQEKVLEILKPDLRLVGNFLQAKMPLVDNDSWINIKEITNKKELEVLKKKLG